MVSWSGAAAVMFFVGSLLSSAVHINTTILLVAGILFVAIPFLFCLTVYLDKRKQVWILAIVPAFLYLGFAVTQLSTDETRRSIYPYMGEDVTVRGTICSVPVCYDGTNQFMMEVSSVNKDGKNYNVKEKIKVSTDAAIPPGGSGVRVTGKLKLITPPRNSTSFNSENYNRRRGVYFSIFGESVSADTSVDEMSVANKIIFFTNSFMNTFIDMLPESSPELKAIILNNKSEIPDEITDSMIRTGTYRYLYCPFLHISLLVFALEKLIGNRRSKFFVGLCVFVLYLFMNVTMTSAWKICLFFFVSYFTMGVFRKRDVKCSMYLAVLFTGIISPLTLHEPGFIIAVAATILVREYMSFTSRYVYKFVHNRRLAGFIGLNIIIVVGMFPLCSFFGYAITPWSVLLGLLFMPAMALIYILFYSCFAIYLLTGQLVLTVIPYLVKGLMFVVQGVEKLPLATLYPGKCSIIFVIAFYLFLYCLFCRLCERKFKLGEKLVILLVCTMCAWGVYGINDAEVTFLSVDNSDCCIITLPNRKTVMIDGGGSAPYSDYDMGKSEVVPYLRAEGINKIETIIVSHYDKDHVDGVITVLKDIPVKEIFLPDYLPNNDYRDIIESEAKLKNVKIHYINGLADYMVAKSLKCEFLHANNGTDANDNSIVVRISYGNTSMLFPGDISKFAEYNLTDVSCDMLKVPHHGSKTSSSEIFIERTSPQFGVVCVGANNSYGHPAKEVVLRYEKSGVPLLRTDQHGDIHFVISKNRIKRVYSFKKGLVYGGI